MGRTRPSGRRLRIAFFVGGVALFAFLVREIGVGRILANLRSTGWLLVPIVLLYAVVYACYAGAWHLIMAHEPRRPPFLRTWLISVSSFAINYVTPLMQIGGEGYRGTAVAPWLGARRATGSVVTYYLLHALSNMVVWLLAVGLALALYVRDAALALGFSLLGLGIALLTAFILARHRGGLFADALALLERIPPARPLARRLATRRETLLALDAQIADFYFRDRRRFLIALALDLTGRLAGVVEFILIGRGMGIAVGYVPALVITGLGAFVINALSFMPFEVGAKEGGFYVIFALLGLSPALGVSAAIVMRLRELAWIATGLGLVALTPSQD